MTLYAGELLRITSTGADFDGTAFTPSNVTGVDVTIFSGEGIVLMDAAMDWDAGEGVWSYLWDTDGANPGSYRYRVTYTDLDGKQSWEWKRARLARNPF